MWQYQTVYHADFNTEQRRRLASRGQAMPDGGFPIRNVSDLKNAIQAYGRATNKPAVKAWIKKRARALGAEDLLPDNWRDDVIKHYGVLGMKWGVRRNPSRAYRKATQKADRLKKDYDKKSFKSQKAEAESAKLDVKVTRSRKRDQAKVDTDFYRSSSRTKRLEKKQKKVDRKTSKINRRANEAYRKSVKWEASMRKVFRDTKVSDIDPSAIEAGRDYVYMLIND